MTEFTPKVMLGSETIKHYKKLIFTAKYEHFTCPMFSIEQRLINELCVYGGVFVYELEKKSENPTNRKTYPFLTITYS